MDWMEYRGHIYGRLAPTPLLDTATPTLSLHSVEYNLLDEVMHSSVK